jgi:hypothetical protein
MEEVVKVHYVVRRSEPLRPRVMRRLPVRGRRSVGAGLRRRGFELRNHHFGASTLCYNGEDKTVCSVMRVAYRPTESETLCMCRSSMRGNRESPGATELVLSSVQLGKVRDRNPSMYVTGQSDRPIVPQKPSNKGSQPVKTGRRPAEMVEGRGLTKGKSFESSTRRTQSRRERYGEL